MTSAASAPSSPNLAGLASVSRKAPPATKKGFTLIELLVVISVIAILIGVLIPVVYRAQKAARRTATANTLQTISAALEAYRTDFGDYPRETGVYTLAPNRVIVNSGAAILTKGLIGPGPDFGNTIATLASTYNAANTYLPGAYARDPQSLYVAVRRIAPGDTAGPVNGGPDNYWTRVDARDSANGPGIRARYVNADGDTNFLNDPGQGRVYGPYLQPEKFKLSGLAMLDMWDNPILYFPASLLKTNITVGGGGPAPGYLNATDFSALQRVNTSLYDMSDNLIPFRRGVSLEAANDYSKATKRIRAMLGDMNQNGAIDSGETAATTGAYILWSAGPDGLFGPNFTDTDPNASDVQNCDDVLSFK